jgi:hypothetical protein
MNSAVVLKYYRANHSRQVFPSFPLFRVAKDANTFAQAGNECGPWTRTDL